MKTIKLYRQRFKALLFLGFSLISISLLSQTTTITGNVISDDGMPLPGVSILVKNTANGTQTDFDGKYEIDFDSKKAILVFSYVGFTSQEIPVNGKSTISVTLQTSQQSLNEVVVIGYGSVKKSDLTGSVTSIKADELNSGANVSVQQALQGRAAGVEIYQKSGEPGSAMAVNIRGASSISAGNDPLYVIDGVPVNNGIVAGSGGAGFVGGQNARNPLNSLNPEDIASIEILKDASSTAIYGSRGSNGVVLITTKSGKSGSLKVTYDTYAGIQTVANSLDLLNAQDYMRVLNNIIDDGGGSKGERVTEIQGNGTDWQDELYRNAIIQNHNIGFSGGSDKISYFASLNYFNQEGVVKNSGIQRYNARINLSVKEDKKYSFGVNLNTSYIYNDYASNGTGINAEAGAIYTAINYDPTVRPYDENGDYNRAEFLLPMDSPLALLNGENAYSNDFRTYGDIYGEYYLVPSLSAKIKLGADVTNGRRDVFVEPYTLTGSAFGGLASIITQRRDYFLVEGTLNFNKDFGDDNVNAVVGATYERFGSTSFSGDARGFVLPDLKTDGIGSGDPTLNNLGSGSQAAKFGSFLGRVNYSLNNKYLLTASLRADGSSRFGPNNRFGYFPSGAIAWKLQEEDFLKDSETLSELKLRGSYGVIGNANIANYLYISTFDTGGNVVFGNNQYTTINPGTTAPNPDLKWESANQLDIGIDFGLFKNRISGTIDYYNRKTSDLLLREPLPPNTGFTGITTNVGSMRNTGLELSISGKFVKTPDFIWDVVANFTTIKNEVLNIGSAESIITGGSGFTGGVSIIRPGDPLNSYYGYIVDGVWQEGDDFSTTDTGVSPGDLKYRDIDNNGTINADDRTIIGQPFPDYSWGLTNTFKYKGLSLSFYLQGVHGISVLNNNLVDTYFPISFRRNKFAKPYINRWTPENPTNEYPSFVNPNAQGQRLVNTKTVEDASYLRLQSAKLAYDIPMDNISFFSRLNVYVTGQNLFTITDYSGADPSANTAGSDVLRIDNNTYPFSRTYLVGINVSF
jgi:TonB-linked SusC/RagA family outer membrane protein